MLYSLFLSDLSLLSEPVLSPPPSPLLDLRLVFNDQDECEAGSPEPSASHVENNSHASVKGNLSIVSVSEADADAHLHICNCHLVKIDRVVNLPEENLTSSGVETSVTGSTDAVSMKTQTQKCWCCRQWAVLIFLCRAWKPIP